MEQKNDYSAGIFDDKYLIKYMNKLRDAVKSKLSQFARLREVNTTCPPQMLDLRLVEKNAKKITKNMEFNGNLWILGYKKTNL